MSQILIFPNSTRKFLPQYYFVYDGKEKKISYSTDGINWNWLDIIDEKFIEECNVITLNTELGDKISRLINEFFKSEESK